MLLRLRTFAILAFQVFLIFGALFLAWALRFDFTLPHLHLFWMAFPVLALMRTAAFVRFRLLHGYWRYVGVSDAKDIGKAVLLGTAGFYLAERWVLGVVAFPRSVYVLEAVLTGVAMGGVRLLSRALLFGAEKQRAEQSNHRVLVVGAGAAASMLLFELNREAYHTVGLVDDDPTKRDASLRGVPVLGGVEDIPELVKRLSVSEVLVAIPSATGQQMQRIAEYCHLSGAKFRTVPGLADLLEGSVTLAHLREVSVEDLLGRDAVHLDKGPSRQQLCGRSVMVTGAAGSIGSELCQQILSFEPRRLVCVDQDESGLFYLERRLQSHTGAIAVDYRVADVYDAQRMRSIFEEEAVEVVLHAAAYKHVPLMEGNIGEAVRNNVFGLMVLLDVAERCNCRDFLLISSDKAVNPSNVMGCTKRICELIMAARPKGGMRRVCVRFGNVLGSQGSVVPIMQEQIANHKRVTVTHPDVTRFFMTISEAVSLILAAFAIGKHGEILALEMGQPIRIVELARTMIRLLGKKQGDIEIVYTGLRKGEKLHEELFYASESVLLSECEKVLRTRGFLMSWPVLQQHLRELEAVIYSSRAAVLHWKLKEIVPEYTSIEPLRVEGKPVISQVPSRSLGRAAGTD